MTPTERDDIAEMVAQSRAAQGLAPTVTDPDALARVSMALRGRVGGARNGREIA